MFLSMVGYNPRTFTRCLTLRRPRQHLPAAILNPPAFDLPSTSLRHFFDISSTNFFFGKNFFGKKIFRIASTSLRHRLSKKTM
jgi:hypothetical protein